MAITVKYFASVREYMGKKTDVVTKDNIKVVDLIKSLEGENGNLDKLLLKGGKLKPQYKIMINGRDIEFLDGIDTRVKDGDIVAIFPPVGGG